MNVLINAFLATCPDVIHTLFYNLWFLRQIKWWWWWWVMMSWCVPWKWWPVNFDLLPAVLHILYFLNVELSYHTEASINIYNDFAVDPFNSSKRNYSSFLVKFCHIKYSTLNEELIRLLLKQILCEVNQICNSIHTNERLSTSIRSYLHKITNRKYDSPQHRDLNLA